MKKLLVVATVALMTTSAFAKSHMVRFYGWDGGARNNSFDFSTVSNDADGAAETSTTNIALNYAYAVTSEIQIGATYRSYTGTAANEAVGATKPSDVARTTMGISGYYNLDGDIGNTNYLALHYDMTNWGEADSEGAKDDSQTDLILEFGHRWTVGTGWGFDLTYAPSVTYTMTTFSPDAAGSNDVVTSQIGWNFLKVDVLF